MAPSIIPHPEQRGVNNSQQGSTAFCLVWEMPTRTPPSPPQGLCPLLLGAMHGAMQCTVQCNAWCNGAIPADGHGSHRGAATHRATRAHAKSSRHGWAAALLPELWVVACSQVCWQCSSTPYSVLSIILYGTSVSLHASQI